MRELIRQKLDDLQRDEQNLTAMLNQTRGAIALANQLLASPVAEQPTDEEPAKENE